MPLNTLFKIFQKEKSKLKEVLHSIHMENCMLKQNKCHTGTHDRRYSTHEFRLQYSLFGANDEDLGVENGTITQH